MAKFEQKTLLKQHSAREGGGINTIPIFLMGEGSLRYMHDNNIVGG
jgi:hypothetical protein